MRARLTLGNRRVVVDLSAPIHLARPLRFAGRGPVYFGAPLATARPLEVAGRTGCVRRGASCNCSVLEFAPHCHATHTECVGHLTRERHDARKVIPGGLLPALLLSMRAVPIARTEERSSPRTSPSDLLVTRRELERAWRLASAVVQPRALVMRVRPRGPRRGYPAYFSSAAAQWLVERGIEHLVIEAPSLDRLDDDGALAAHRVFFGLPPRSRSLRRARRRNSTITELARIPRRARDGLYLLQLQIPEFDGDAVPSRPTLYRALLP